MRRLDVEMHEWKVDEREFYRDDIFSIVLNNIVAIPHMKQISVLQVFCINLLQQEYSELHHP